LDLIISHVNADFDCLGSLTAAGRLYPDALLCFPGSQEKNLREFSARHADLIPPLVRPKDLDLSRITRLIIRSEEHTSELQSHHDLVCRLLLEKKT